MFHRAELERLRLEKELLTLQCDANRLVMIARWQDLSSREYWLQEATNAVRRHPVLVAGLAGASGLLLVQFFRRPGQIFSGFGQLMSLVPMALSIWKTISAGDQMPAATESSPASESD
jgi:hypothetical protein